MSLIEKALNRSVQALSKAVIAGGARLNNVAEDFLDPRSGIGGFNPLATTNYNISPNFRKDIKDSVEKAVRESTLEEGITVYDVREDYLNSPPQDPYVVVGHPGDWEIGDVKKAFNNGAKDILFLAYDKNDDYRPFLRPPGGRS